MRQKIKFQNLFVSITKFRERQSLSHLNGKAIPVAFKFIITIKAQKTQKYSPLNGFVHKTKFLIQ